MKKVKIGYWASIFVLLVLFFVQNQEFFMQKKDFVYNLIHIKTLADLEIKWFMPHKTPETYLVILFAITFLTGVVLTFIYGLFSQIQNSRKFRFLNRTCEAHLQKIADLESELRTLRASSPGLDEDIINISSKSSDPR